MSEAVAVEDAVSTKERKKDPLYAERVRVYPKAVSGTFRRLKWAALIALLGIYYVVPWIRWDRGPDAPNQAVLADIVNGRLFFFWIEIWPQEIYYLTGLLIMAAVGLFLVTSLAGRVWCGYACPQTVWTDLFMWVERLIEGDRNARQRLDKASLTLGKALRKFAKHGVWLIIAVATGGAWIFYFNDAPTVMAEIVTGQAGTGVYFFIGLFSATTYLLAGWAREQVCTYMCPWPRIQAAMLDEDSLIVTYQDWRGEPRGRHRKGQKEQELGDCVDCNLCVAVCPTGIDIRDGQQLECIGCALCIDACNSVMAKVDKPLGLITYDTQRNQDNRAAGKPLIYRLIRPRVLIYSLLLLTVSAVMLWTLAIRSTLEITVQRDRSPLFVTLSDGSVRNGYTIKILNKTRETRSYTLTFQDLPGAELAIVGRNEGGPILFEAGPDSVATYRLYLTLAKDEAPKGGQPFTFVLRALVSGDTAHHETVFRGPES